MNRRRFRALAGATCVVACIGALAPAHAATADRQMPINYSADGDMTGNANEGNATFRKNVLITQGTTVVHSDTLILKHNDDNSFNATAIGDPASFRTRADNSDEFREAFAKKIVYDGKAGVVELYGDALLKQGQSEQRGQYVRYDLNSGQFVMGATPGTPETASTPARVRGVFMPKQDTEKGADGKAPAKDAKDAKGNAPKAPAAKDGAAAQTPAKATTPAPIADPVPLKSATDLSTAPR